MPPPVVLVVDDDATIRALVAEILETDGYTVALAADGLAALAVLAHTTPALLILDLRMPLLDGWGVLRALRDRRPPLPVLALTAVAEPARVAGATMAVLAKPFDLDVVVEAVACLIGPAAG